MKWELARPPVAPALLAEIRAFRARVLYDGGRRPALRDGDADPADERAWHVLARDDGLVACGRLTPEGDGGRWIVSPERRGHGVAVDVIAGIWAVARALGLTRVVVQAGTRDGQDRALMRAGARDVGAPLVCSETFDDELRTLVFDVAAPPARLSALIDRMVLLLRLRD